ncbi:hypothetical protein HYV64_03915 [Candidatus Shapirobacteria bacterium]|nr:hypothetical protein [Candidatus Shapirobacteria bacterium]
MAIDKIGLRYIPSEAVFVGEKVVDEAWKKVVVENAEIARREVLGVTDTPRARDGINLIFKNLNVMTGGSYGNANELVDAVENDPGNENLALGQLMLAQSVYLAMRDGGNVKMEGALASGTATTIENELPARLKGIAREVRNLEITSPKYRNILDEMDANAALDKWQKLPPSVDEQRKLLEMAMTSLKTGGNGPVNDEEKREYSLVVRSLRARLNILDAGGDNALLVHFVNEKKERESSVVDQLRQRAEEGSRQKADYFKAMAGGATPDSFVSPSSPMAPEWLKGMEPRHALLLTELNNASFMLGRVSGIGEVVQGSGLFRTDDDGMDFLLNQTPGAREAFAFILQTYFDPVDEEGNIFDPSVDRRSIVNVRLKVDDKVLMSDFVGNRVFDNVKGYLVGMRPPIDFGDGILGKEAGSSMAVGVVLALSRVGFMFNDADPKRKMGKSNLQNQVWNANYPAAKGAQKFKKAEPWAGSQGDWLFARQQGAVTVSKNQAKEIEFVERWESGEINPLPERLMINFFANTEVTTATSGKVSMIEALYFGYEIIYEQGSNDDWVSYQDVVRAAAGAFEYMKGGDKQKLMLGKNEGEWANGIRSIVSDLSKNEELAPQFSNEPLMSGGKWVGPSPLAERMLWFIGACGGLANIPDLIVTQGADKFQDNAMRNVVDTTAMKIMLPNEADREWILKQLSCDGKGQIQIEKNKWKRRSLLGLPNSIL